MIPISLEWLVKFYLWWSSISKGPTFLQSSSSFPVIIHGQPPQFSVDYPSFWQWRSCVPPSAPQQTGTVGHHADTYPFHAFELAQPFFITLYCECQYFTAGLPSWTTKVRIVSWPSLYFTVIGVKEVLNTCFCCWIEWEPTCINKFNWTWNITNFNI